MQRVPKGQRGTAIERFRDRLMAATPRAWVTHGLVVANIAYFAFNVGNGVSPMSPTGCELLRYGANFAPLTATREPYRLVTSMFLHVGVLHIAFNMWVLLQAGVLIERLYGNWIFAVVYLLSGIGGSAASVVFTGGLSAGASGAVFGVFGALLAYLVVQRRAIPAVILRSLKSSALAFVGYNVLFGLLLSHFIDNAAHLGGLATGFAAGVIGALPFDQEGVRKRGRRALVLIVVGGIACFFILTGLRSLAPRFPDPDRARAQICGDEREAT